MDGARPVNSNAHPSKDPLSYRWSS
jgi:hypothetical protein